MSLSSVVATCLGAVAALGHVAPASAAIPARVDEQPPAIRTVALADTIPLVGNEEVGGRPSDDPGRPIKLILRAVPSPGDGLSD